jgi:hypothetical protein
MMCLAQPHLLLIRHPWVIHSPHLVSTKHSFCVALYVDGSWHISVDPVGESGTVRLTITSVVDAPRLERPVIR